MTKYAMPTASDKSRLFAHVAALSCMRDGCEGGCGPVQVAHSNQQIDGKGMGLKSYPWRIAALGQRCHTDIDSGSRLTKDQRREQWDSAHRRTIGELFARGLVRPI